jgi:hypothetical protein
VQIISDRANIHSRHNMYVPLIGWPAQVAGDISFEAIFLAGIAPTARDMYAAGAYQNLTGIERCGTRRGTLDARMRGILLLRFDNS